MILHIPDNEGTGIDYNKLRFKPEAEIERILEEEYSLSQYYDIFDSKDDLEAITSEMLSNALLLNRIIAPRIYDICDEVKTKLAFNDVIDFYLYENAEANAFSLNGFGLVPHIISFTSSLIQQVSDDELRWIIGHEIGHLIYSHNKLDVAQRFIPKGENDRPPAGMTIHYYRYRNYSEISADRIGFVAMPDIETVTKSLFKLTYGLSDDLFKLDIDEYMKQLDRIKEINVGNLFSSHPNSMIRIKALLDFSVSDLFIANHENTISATSLDDRVLINLQLLEIHPRNNREKKIVDFLSAVGMYMACCDEETMSQKWDVLYDWISDYSTKPEQYLQFETYDEIVEKTTHICHQFAKEASDDTFPLLERVIGLTLMDGRLEPEEKKRLFEISGMMNVSQDAMNLTIKRVSENYLAPNRKNIVKRFL
ncbi:hypothetical protein MASR1M36_21350 [Candidatus Cloacimonadaceae bacterium]